VSTGVLALGTTELGRNDLGNTPGQDGITGLHGANGYAFFVGTVNGRTSTGLKTLRNAETIEFNLLACPGVSHRSVIAEMSSLCQSRGDSVYLVDPPLGLSAEEVVDWHNGLRSTSNGGPDATAPSAPLNDSYGGLYWTWQEIDDPYTRKTIWLPPSCFVAALMAANDDTNGPWWAVAGKVRGVLQGTNRGEYSPARDDRELLVGGSNRVNPIPNFADAGWTIYGNRTLSRLNSALNSMHVRRMLIYAEKVCASAVSFLVFNPNDPQTWAQFTRLCNTELSSIAARRGIEWFRVICDESTNPPAQRQQKTMRGKLLIKPIEAAEIILLDFAIFATGATFSEPGF
jgi:phage tail sheath protein FI